MFDITTQGITGFTGSLTNACSGNNSSGMLTPAIAITTLVWPAVTTPMRPAAIGPLVVSTPVAAPAASRTMPVTAQFWMMSTPIAEAARA